MKNSTKKEKRWKYLLFSCIGILSFLICEYWREEIFHPSLGGPSEIYFTLLIYSILFGSGLYVSKEKSVGFVLKAFVVSFITLILIFGGFFVWGAHQHYYAKWIDVDELKYIPSEYVTISNSELEQFPALKEAVVTLRPVKAHSKEWENLYNLIEEKSLEKYSKTWTDAIRVGEKYYLIGFMTA